MNYENIKKAALENLRRSHDICEEYLHRKLIRGHSHGHGLAEQFETEDDDSIIEKIIDL